MENLKRITLNIDFREDYNARPKSYLCDEYMILKTHPFYCCESGKYGKCYRYDLININHNKQINNFNVYCYDNFDNVIDLLIVDIFRDLSNNIIKTYNISDPRFIVYNPNNNRADINLEFEFKSNNYTNKKELKKFFEYAKLNDNVHGIIFYDKDMFLMVGNFNKEYFINRVDINTNEVQDSEYYDLFIKKTNNLPSESYTKYNKKYKEGKADQDDSNSDSDDSDDFPFYKNYVYKKNKIMGQVFSCPGMIDILFMDN